MEICNVIEPENASSALRGEFLKERGKRRDGIGDGGVERERKWRRREGTGDGGRERERSLEGKVVILSFSIPFPFYFFNV